MNLDYLKFIYSENATKFFEISTSLLSYVVPVKSKVEILQNFVAFSEFMNFTRSNFQNSLLLVEFQGNSELVFRDIGKDISHFLKGNISTKILLMYIGRYIWLVLTTFFILNKILILVTANFVALKNAYQIIEKN